MKKIKLGVKVPLAFEDEDGKIVEKFEVIYRPANKKQRKALGDDNETILKLFSEADTIRKIVSAQEDEVAALKALEGKSKEVAELSGDLRKQYSKLQKIEQKFEENGGFDKLLGASEKNFDLNVHGKDKETLKEFIENNSGFQEVLQEIEKEAARIKTGNVKK